MLGWMEFRIYVWVTKGTSILVGLPYKFGVKR